MKYIKWKILILTCIVILLPILLGIALWDNLPDQMAIHFNIHNQPDNFSSKGFAVFGLPLLMVPLQIICCLINDINAHKYGDRIKFERITKWIIPVMSIILNLATFGFNLGHNIEMSRVAALLVGAIFLATGNYLPKLDYVKNYNTDTEKARKINRFIGYGSVIMGILFLVTVFLPPIYTLICVILLIPYAIVSIIYGIRVGRSK